MSDDKDEYPLGEMAVLLEADYKEMVADLMYWETAAAMLAEILQDNNIDYDLSEGNLNEWIKNQPDPGG